MMFVHGVDSKTDIADHLYQSDVLSTEEKEEICNSSLTQQERMKKLKDRHEKKDILMDHDEIIPKHILEQFEKRLEQWKKDDQQFEELVCTKDIHNKDKALGGSCYMGTIDLVKWLISRNSDINYCREDGCFPLLWATDVNKCDFKGKNPLNVAQEQGHIEIESLLKGKGVNQH
ncbi:unnamed protein product [Mytilus edulis]|uniref:CARD domain-containing protein n=1 Tax=Mytilus edulis TaxID=6550 RepID=A0A8S3UTT7_MYTED|nr:unnamed protein product [Mytilus edulis]